MMINNSIRIGIIGAGTNTCGKHIPLLQKIYGVEIVGVCNRTEASSQKVAREFDIPEVYSDWREAIDDPELDAIVIGTWPYLHAPASIAALEAGKHVLCEARMAMNLSQAKEMLEVAQLNPDLIAQLVPAPFTFRVDATIQRLLAEGYLGELLSIEVRGGGGFIDRESPLNWRHDVGLSGLNTMMMGVFYESVMRWIGHADSVLAMGKTFVKTRKNTRGVLQAIAIPDHLDILASMLCGAQAHLQFSSVNGHSGPVEISLYGSEATLRFCENKLYGGTRSESELAELKLSPSEEGHWRVEEDFIAAIRGEKEVELTTFADGLKYMEFTEAVALSLQSGQLIKLPIL